jgi:hypothetical protein
MNDVNEKIVDIQGDNIKDEKIDDDNKLNEEKKEK